jgi:hypothetical protein
MKMDTGSACCSRLLKISMHSRVLHPAIITHFRETDIYGAKQADSVNGLSMVKNTNLMLLIATYTFETFDKTKSTL